MPTPLTRLFAVELVASIGETERRIRDAVTQMAERVNDSRAIVEQSRDLLLQADKVLERR